MSEIARSYEETALLSGSATPIAKKRVKQPLPRLQLSIILLVQLAEPISATCILPFINQMIGEFDIVGRDPAKVGYYVGLMVSLFFATEAVTVLHWSRLSDRIGRKPVLLMGLAGNAISLPLFGLSRTFWALVLSRCLCGALNGNTGVAKSAIGEITDSTNRARAFALMPVIWAIGLTVAPLMGGTLQRSADRFPQLFDHPFWRTYPYFLPCFIAALCSVAAFLVTAVCFEETLHHSSGPILIHSTSSSVTSLSETETVLDGPDSPILQDLSVGRAPGYQEEAALGSPWPLPTDDQPVPLRSLIRNRNVVVAIANYGTLAVLDIAYGALQPVFYASPLTLGGLQLDPPTIGLVLGMFGLANGCFQAFAFAPIVKWFGSKNTFVAGISMFLLVFSFFPAINTVALREGGVDAVVWLMVALQLSFGMIVDMSFSSVFLYVSSAAPNRRTLGATNGLAQLTASVVRAIGPTLSTSLFAFSVEKGWMGGYGVYVVLMTLTLAALRVALLLPKEA